MFKRLNKILEMYLTDKDVIPNDWERISNWTKIGNCTLINPGRNWIILSPEAKSFVEAINVPCFITTGAEGKHAEGMKYSHVNGNKLDLQPKTGSKFNYIEYAKLIMDLLQNPRIVYVNMESFTHEDINNIKYYIYTKNPDLKEIAETDCLYPPNTNKKKCDGKVLTSVYTGYAKHLDIAFN